MNDKKSKMPDLDELGSMAGKLFKDLKNSVTEIVKDYKAKRYTEEQSEKQHKPTETAQPQSATEKKPEPPKAKATKPKVAPDEVKPEVDKPDQDDN